jgi:hypothetical protein
MAKLVFPSVNAPYRGFVGEVRGWLNRTASWLEKSPGGKATLESQIKAFVTQTDLTVTDPLPSTQKIIVSGTKVTAPEITGTYVDGYTFTIVDGTITAIVAS